MSTDKLLPVKYQFLDELRMGDIVRHKTTGNAYVVDNVVDVEGFVHVTAVRTARVSNPREWDLLRYKEATNDRD